RIPEAAVVGREQHDARDAREDGRALDEAAEADEVVVGLGDDRARRGWDQDGRGRACSYFGQRERGVDVRDRSLDDRVAHGDVDAGLYRAGEYSHRWLDVDDDELGRALLEVGGASVVVFDR